MDKAIAICLTALLLLAGCLSSEDEEAIDDAISIEGCDNEDALNYDENSTGEFCASEELLEDAIVDFILLMDEGPDMETLTSTVGYSMEVSSVMDDETWHYMETMVISPDGMKLTVEDNYGEESMIVDIIVSGNHVQYSFNNDTVDYTVLMNHEGTILEAFDAMINIGMDMDMGDDMDSGEMFVCDNGDTIPADYVNDGMYDCEDRSDEDNEIEMFVCDNGDTIPADWVNDGEDDCDDGSDESDNDGTEGESDDEPPTPEELLIMGDADENGALSWEEAESLVTETIGFSLNEEATMQLKDAFDESDSDSSGDLTGNELDNFIQVVYTLFDEMDNDDIDYETMFMMMDASGDGEITATEWKDFMESIGESLDDDEGVMIVMMVEQFDADNSGGLDLAEFELLQMDATSDSTGGDDGNGMDNGGMNENPESDDYTEDFNPVTATFSDFEITETGMVFHGLLNVEGAPFGALAIHTTLDFTVTGFSMMDVNEENNWVKFTLINSGETLVDNTLALSALPFVLVDSSDFEGDDMEDDMVCYNFETHEVVDIYDEMDCLDAGAEYMWTSMDRDDDDSDDGHTGENSWTFERGMEDCDSDNDAMVSYEELVVCINNDLSNDGFGDMSASDVGADLMFNMSDMDGDSFLSSDELDYLNSMYSSGEDDRDGNDEDSRAHYECVNFVDESIIDTTMIEEDFSSVFDNSNLDDSLCGTPANDVNYSFDNSTFNLPLMMVYEECSTDENNTTMCYYGTIEAVNGTELWDHSITMDESDCNGEFDTDTYMCTEYIGKIDDSDANAFTISNHPSKTIVMYQYDAESGSGLLMIVEERHDGDDASPEDMFAILDANGDGEVTASEWSDSSNGSDEPMNEQDFEVLKAMMHQFDEDGSEGLNFAEFENMIGMNDGDDGDDGDMMDDMQVLIVMSMVNLEGDLNDYSFTLANCDEDMVCGDDVYSVKLSDIVVTEESFLFSGYSVMFIDMDESGTLNSGDMIMIDTSSLEVDGEFNTPRLHSKEADSYADENPMPGFTGILATIGLLGAALIRRE
jgi:Ca2+-binding EF-hand superfamily protein